MKKFENFSINELQDWTTLPVDVNKGLGDMMNKFASEFPELINQLKKSLGSGFTKFKESLEQLTQVVLVDGAQDDIKSFFGNINDKKQMQAKVEDLVNEELRKEGLLKESRYSRYNSNRMNELNLFGKPKLTPSEYRLQKELGVLSDEDEKRLQRILRYKRRISGTETNETKQKLKRVYTNIFSNIFSRKSVSTFMTVITAIVDITLIGLSAIGGVGSFVMGLLAALCITILMYIIWAIGSRFF